MIKKGTLFSILFSTIFAIHAEVPSVDEQIKSESARRYFEQKFPCAFGGCSKVEQNKIDEQRQVLFEPYEKEVRASRSALRRMGGQIIREAFAVVLDNKESDIDTFVVDVKVELDKRNHPLSFIRTFSQSNARLIIAAVKAYVQKHPETVQGILNQDPEILQQAQAGIIKLVDYGYKYEGIRRYLGLNVVPYAKTLQTIPCLGQLFKPRNEDPFDPRWETEAQEVTRKKEELQQKTEKEIE